MSLKFGRYDGITPTLPLLGTPSRRSFACGMYMLSAVWGILNIESSMKYVFYIYERVPFCCGAGATWTFDGRLPFLFVIKAAAAAPSLLSSTVSMLPWPFIEPRFVNARPNRSMDIDCPALPLPPRFIIAASPPDFCHA